MLSLFIMWFTSFLTTCYFDLELIKIGRLYRVEWCHIVWLFYIVKFFYFVITKFYFE